MDDKQPLGNHAVDPGSRPAGTADHTVDPGSTAAELERIEERHLAATAASQQEAMRPEVIASGTSLGVRLHDFAENRNPYNPPERLYTDRRSEQVNRLDATPLTRPFDLPKRVKATVGVVAAIATVAGGFAVFNIAQDVLLRDQREQAAIQQTLSKETTWATPVLKDLAVLDDESMRAALEQAAGTPLIDIDALQGQDKAGLDLYRLPEGVTEEDAKTTVLLMTTTGLVSGSDAVNVLHGGWRILVDRGEYLNMNLRYADFVSTSIEEAIANAIAAQGLDGTATSDIAQDASGNTIQTGTVDIAGVPYAWQVSVCPLSEVYAIDGIPESALYVGIRLHQ